MAIENFDSLRANYLKDNLRYKNYLEFLKERREQSKADLENLAQNFNIPLEKLQQIRTDIRKQLLSTEDKDYAAITTTFHLLPWELEYYLLAKKRINLLDYKPTHIFDIPIGYMQSKDEKPHQLTIGDRSFNYLELIFNVKKVPKTSYEFYLLLKEEFKKFLDLEEVDFSNLKEIVDGLFANQQFINSKIKPICNHLKSKNLLRLNKQELRIRDNAIDKLYEDIVKEIIYLIVDFLVFFENDIKINEKREKFLKTVKYLFSQEDLRPIFNALGLSLNVNIDDFLAFNDYGKIIFLIVILGGFDHIGAEWPEKDKLGKYNLIRKSLGLNLITEVPPNTFAERFLLFSESSLSSEANFKLVDSLTLRLLFSEAMPSITYLASFQGPFTGTFSPLAKEHRDIIRIIDFVSTYKLFLQEIKNGDIKFSNKMLIDIIKKYYETVFKGGIKEMLKNKIEEFEKNYLTDNNLEYDLFFSIEQFNKFLNESGIKDYSINLPLLMSIILENEIFNAYFKTDIQRLVSKEGGELLNKFLATGRKIKRLENFFEHLNDKQLVGNQDENTTMMFGGISLPFNLQTIDSDFIGLVMHFRRKLMFESRL
ncbi:MAG: hypothetical protein KatS3mg097_496 [Candidatus Parcubacteria bacterium]|nr:MAG: hypothetical protein KatS3mg097_496 [Candidatus Parcubacteria bacterium]